MLRKSNYADISRYHETKREQMRRYRQRTGSNQQPTAWTQEHIQKVMEHTIPDRKLAQKIGHSVASIQIMRSRMKKAEKERSLENV